MMTTRGVSKRLGVSVWRLRYLILAGKVPEPDRLEGRMDWIWSDQLVEQARQAIAATTAGRPVRSV
jgi:hypothetical protein